MATPSGRPAGGLRAGDMVRIRVDWTIASELAWNGMKETWEALGRPAIHDPQRFYLAIDHTVDPVTLVTDKRVQKLVQHSRDFARDSGLLHFYDANETIMHTRFYRDLVQPGEVVLGADSHTSEPRGHGGVCDWPGRRRHHRRHGAGRVVDPGARGHRGGVSGAHSLRVHRQRRHPQDLGRAGPQHRGHGALGGVRG